MSAAVITILLAACGGGGATGSESTESLPASSAIAAPSPSTQEPSTSTSAEESGSAAAPCLPADVFAAVEDISNVVEPSVPAEEIADGVEALDLAEFDDDVVGFQDDLVSRLREGDTNSFDLQVAAGYLLATTNLTAC
jgi:hypothetical protein